MSNEDKIIGRIQKMLALANDLAATEGERDNALRMAYATMAKYNIEMARVEAAGKKVEEPRVRFDSPSWSWQWAKQVNGVVAKLFFCKVLIGRKINGTQQEFIFIGRESNAMTAAVMSDWIVNSILKEGRKIYKQNTAPGTRAFAIGAMYKLNERISQIIAERQAEGVSDGTALVLASLYKTEADANEAFMNEMFGGIMKAKKARQSKVDAIAFAQGAEFGAKINLNQQLESAKVSTPALR